MNDRLSGMLGCGLSGTLGCGFAILFFGFGLLQLAAGWAGIENEYGRGWGIAAIIAALLFRFTLPIAFGAFLCARDIWHWHWSLALLFAAPTLLFMIPAVLAALVGAVRR